MIAPVCHGSRLTTLTDFILPPADTAMGDHEEESPSIVLECGAVNTKVLRLNARDDPARPLK